MKNKGLPLQELSIKALYNGEKVTYEVPIYQRNYAWEKDEIYALIQDVYDAFIAGKTCYYIGTLVSYNKGDQVFEIIDGQQRLTTINLILSALGVTLNNKLTYRARKKSTKTINYINNYSVEEKSNGGFFDIEPEEKDIGIINGYKYAQASIKEIVPVDEIVPFTQYFQNNVHIIHYQVPKDVDLNHYFEVMNSRGEQLEKHEIVKAKLMGVLTKQGDRDKFNLIWENCSDMSVYVQDKYYSNDKNLNIFGNWNNWLCVDRFDALPNISNGDKTEHLTISGIINASNHVLEGKSFEKQRKDSFQPIIDFSNFLLIVLKITRFTTEEDFVPGDFNLDDKELLNEFSSIKLTFTEEWVKTFGFNLLKAKFLLDNFIVHHSNEEDTIENNPWKLQVWQKGKHERTGHVVNLCDGELQEKLVQLLSMFEVSFTPRPRKNYLFYCLLYLFNNASFQNTFKKNYCKFVEALANKYFKDVYLNKNLLNAINTPIPSAFDSVILKDGGINTIIENKEFHFEEIYGDGETKSNGISLFVFNYLDYKLWASYLRIRGQKTTESTPERKKIFDDFGCSDFGLDIFKQFYFSRTRRSLEHFFPQANIAYDNYDVIPTEAQINCLGNYAMIGNEINSAGSNWSPAVKLGRYLDEGSKKIKLVSVASIKFMIMMRSCKDNIGTRAGGQEWLYSDIQNHQNKMMDFLKK